MRRHLFEDSFYEYQSAATDGGVRVLQALDRAKFKDGSYKQTIETVVNNAAFKVAKIHPENRKGKRRTERRAVRDYGHTAEIDVTVIDVIIPFSGDRTSFSYAPSSRTILSTQADVLSDTLVVTFYDDESLEKNCNDFIKVVDETLSRLSSEMAGYRGQIKSVLETVATQRLSQIEQQSNLDRDRSFPID